MFLNFFGGCLLIRAPKLSLNQQFFFGREFYTRSYILFFHKYYNFLSYRGTDRQTNRQIGTQILSFISIDIQKKTSLPCIIELHTRIVHISSANKLATKIK